MTKQVFTHKRVSRAYRAYRLSCLCCVGLARRAVKEIQVRV